MDIKKSKLKEILFEKEWFTGVLIPILLGIIVFYTLLWFNRGFSTSLFWGVFSTYMLFGAFISISKSSSGLFERINIAIGLLALLCGIVSLIIFSEIRLLGWPTIIAGIILAIISLLGFLGKGIGDCLSYTDDLE